MVFEEIYFPMLARCNDFSINICQRIISLSIQEDFETETTASFENDASYQKNRGYRKILERAWISTTEYLQHV